MLWSHSQRILFYWWNRDRALEGLLNLHRWFLTCKYIFSILLQWVKKNEIFELVKLIAYTKPKRVFCATLRHSELCQRYIMEETYMIVFIFLNKNNHSLVTDYFCINHVISSISQSYLQYLQFHEAKDKSNFAFSVLSNFLMLKISKDVTYYINYVKYYHI